MFDYFFHILDSLCGSLHLECFLGYAVQHLLVSVLY